MANSFGADILLQANDPREAALFYIEQFGFEVSNVTPTLVSVHGQQINLFIEQGPPLGPVLEITVGNVDETRDRLLKNGCQLLNDEPDAPRTYLKDPFGLIYHLRAANT